MAAVPSVMKSGSSGQYTYQPTLASLGIFVRLLLLALLAGNGALFWLKQTQTVYYLSEGQLYVFENGQSRLIHDPGA